MVRYKTNDFFSRGGGGDTGLSTSVSYGYFIILKGIEDTGLSTTVS